MADTIKLRQLDIFKSLNSNELEILRFNFWMIEQALNSVGAATPLVPGSGTPPTGDHHLLTNLATFDDHPQYLYLAGRGVNQLIHGGASSGTLSLRSDNSGSISGATITLDSPASGYITIVPDSTVSAGIAVMLRVDGKPTGAGDTNYFWGRNVTSSPVDRYVFGDAVADFFNSLVKIIRTPTTLGFDETVLIKAAAATNKALTLRGFSGQSENIQEWQNSSSTILARVNNVGTLFLANNSGSDKISLFANTSPASITLLSAAIGGLTITPEAMNANSTLGGPFTITASIGLTLSDTSGTISLNSGNISLNGLLIDVTTANVVDNTFVLRDGSGITKKATFECSGITAGVTRTFTFPDASGILALTSDLPHNILSATHSDSLTGTVVRGDLIVGNSTPKWSRLPKGSANQALVMDGGGNDPQWALLSASNIADRNRYIWIPAVDWFDLGNGVSLGQSLVVTGTFPTAYYYAQMSGSLDSKYMVEVMMPEDYTGSILFEIFYANNGTSTNTVTFDLYVKSLTNGDLMTAANDISQTNINLTPSGTKDNLNVQTLSVATTGLTAGKLMRISLDRQGADANTGIMNFIGVRITYNADM